MKRKIISTLLAVCMTASLLSGLGISANAEDSSSSILSNGTSISPQTFDKLMTEVVNASIAAENDGEIDFVSKFGTGLYVRSNGIQGITSDITIQFPRDCCCGSLYLPYGIDTTALTIAWDDPDLHLYAQDGTEVYSGQTPVAFSGESVTYTAVKGDLNADIKITTFESSEGVQSMFFNIDESLGTIDAMNNCENHENECYGTLTTSGTDYIISMKGRGNATWDMVKKPYNVTFYKKSDYSDKKKVALINGVETKSKKWSLLANYYDTSLLRNKVALDLAKKLGLGIDSGLDSAFADVWINGQYYGNYTITEKTDYNTPDAGYFLEDDNYCTDNDPEPDHQFLIPEMQELGSTLSNLGSIFECFYNRITIKDIGKDALTALGATESDPTNANEAIESWFDEAWYKVLDYDSEEYQNYFDIESWAKMYLMYEVTKNYDAFSGSILMYRNNTTDSKLYAGPAWDYDNSMGRTMFKLFSGVSLTAQVTAQFWYIDSIGMIVDTGCNSMLQELGKHKSFLQEVAKVYNDNIEAFESIQNDIETQANIVEASALMNTDLWDLHHLNTYFCPVPLTLGTGKYTLNYEITSTWRSFVNNMYEYAGKRVLWLSDHLKNGTDFTGSITNSNGTLKVSVSSGKAGAYQWQYSSDGETWTDIKGATKACYKTSGSGNYRCVVTANGTRMITEHTGKVMLQSQHILDPVTV